MSSTVLDFIQPIPMPTKKEMLRTNPYKSLNDKGIIHPEQIKREYWYLSEFINNFKSKNIMYVEESFLGYFDLYYTLTKLYDGKFQREMDVDYTLDEFIAEYPLFIAESDRVLNFQPATTDFFRWGSCSPDAIKLYCAEQDFTGKVLSNFEHPILNMRGESLFAGNNYSDNYKLIPMMYRPKIELETFDKYPLEFRVFINNSKIVAIANYYIQRLLLTYPSYENLYKRTEEFINEAIDKLKDTDTPFENIVVDTCIDSSGNIRIVDTNPNVLEGITDPCGFVPIQYRVFGPEQQELFTKFINLIQTTNCCIYDFNFLK